MNDTLYRTILLRKGSQGWGFPVPHLLAMRFAKSEKPTEKIDSEIRLYFSSEAMKIEGTSLRVLWNQLLSGLLEEEIRCDTYTVGAETYTVTNIGPL
jgi:hypothetical protein